MTNHALCLACRERDGVRVNAQVTLILVNEVTGKQALLALCTECAESGIESGSLDLQGMLDATQKNA